MWLLDLGASDGEYELACRLLTDGERARAHAVRSESARRRFVLARAAVRLRLGDALGIAPEQVVLRVGEHGKPELAAERVALCGGDHCKLGIAQLPLDAEVDSARVTHRPLRFNLAHGDGVALLAIHPRQDVGIDVERIAPLGKRPWRRLLERICHPSELGEAMAEARELGPRAFYERWVGKEAVLKALGLGLRISPAAVPLRRDADGALRVWEPPARRGCASGDDVDVAAGEGSGLVACRLMAAPTPPGFVGAVALVERAS